MGKAQETPTWRKRGLKEGGLLEITRAKQKTPTYRGSRPRGVPGKMDQGAESGAKSGQRDKKGIAFEGNEPGG